MSWYNNRYVCPDCNATWDSDWSCGCDDECPECEARNISPVSSDDLTVAVEPADDGSWTIWRSPADAEDEPRYMLVGIFKPKRSGKFKFLPSERPI